MKKNYSLFIAMLMLPIAMMGQNCSLTNFSLEETSCSAGGFFSVTIDFDFSEVSDSFVLQGNSLNYGTYAYANLPVTIPNLAGDCQTEYEFVAIDQNDEDCLISWDYGVECCDEACTIEINEVEVGDCDDGLISLSFNLEHRNTSSTSFDVFSRNDFVGSYNYDDLPIRIQDFPSSGGATERLVVCNNDSETCCDTYIFETSCSCIIKDVTAAVIDCNEEDSTFYVFLDLDFNMTSDSFFLGGNNNRYGNFAYSDLPITVGPLPFDEDLEYEFLAVDRLSAFCFDFVDVGVVNGCNACTIFDVKAEPRLCDNDEILVDIEFKTEGEVSDSFSIRGNGMDYGKFPHGEMFYTVGPVPGDCETIYEFIIIDNENPDCRNFTELDEILCCGSTAECNISNPSIDVGDCNQQGEFFVEISFDQQPGVTGEFTIAGNGENYGTFSYGADEYRIGPLSGNCETIYEFILTDARDPLCEEVIELTEEVCCAATCAITNLFIFTNQCNDDNLFTVDISFETSGAVSDSFEVRGNGTFYGTFPYGETNYEIGPLNGDCETIYEFVIVDQNNSDCSVSGMLDEPNCCRENCLITKLEAELICPGDGTITVDIEKDGIPANRELQLLINEEPISGLFIADFPYALPTEGLTFPVEIELREVANQSCRLSVIVEENCDDSCNISGITVSFVECDDQDRLVLTIDATHNREDFNSFKLEINEEEFGFFTYDQLPLVVPEITNPDADFPVTISDATEEGCSISTQVNAIVCQSSIQDVRGLGITAYAQGNNIIVTNNQDEPAEIIISDISGRRIFSGNVYTQLLLEDNLQNGLYILTAKVGNRMASQKIIITQ